MDAALKSAVAVGDYVTVDSGSASGIVVGEVISVTSSAIEYRKYIRMTEFLMQKFSLQPIVETLFPVASQTPIVELVATGLVETSSRDTVADVVFIVPLQELETGMVHITGASNIYFIRYAYDEGRLSSVQSTLYFCNNWIQPFSMRLFASLNMLSYHLKKALYHGTESQEPRKSFRLYFPNEAFFYLYSRVSDHSVIKDSVKRCQRIIKYYDTLKTESATKENDVVYLRILTVPALASLRKVLGIGIGIGCATEKPTKNSPLQYCSINSQLNSIESEQNLPQDLVRKPLSPTKCNGIDFLYIQQNSSLCCHIRFTKIVVDTPEVATSRIPAAYIVRETSSAYVGAWFNHGGVTYEVLSIDVPGNKCRCESVDQPTFVTELPLTLVNSLVDSFGS